MSSRRRLSDAQVFTLCDGVRLELAAKPFPLPRAGQSEESYVAEYLRPTVEEYLRKFGDLTLMGEGGRRAIPAHFLGLFFYPDLAVMHYNDRVLAIEAKYVDFVRSSGALATAVGQAVIYSSSNYRSSLIVTIGQSDERLKVMVGEENLSLQARSMSWRLCTLSHS